MASPQRIVAILCFVLAIVLSLLSDQAQAAVMSIDYGAEWFKVGLIKPGIPLDVALNKDSKRKTQAVVTIRDEQRLYGSDAVALSGRFPHLTYSNLKSIIAKPFDDRHCVEYRHRFSNNMSPHPDRNSVLFKHNEETELSVEELIAYQFQNARDQAKATAGEDVKDVVITVTPFATQYERQAILDAAELAGLNVLSLIHDETAVALNYAISREFTTTPEYHIFYDMGAGSTVASLVSFSIVEQKEGKKTRKVPQLEVKAVGFDRTLGGHEFDVRLQNLLVDKFNEKNPTLDVRQSGNAMTRLLKEANRVKQILSANTETTASLESLYQDVDFKTKVTRAELEHLCADLLERVPNPIAAALKASDMKVEDIKSLVLVGGSVRIPAVQKGLGAVVGTQKIAKNVNGDEAAVLGAAFRGASLSKQFRLTKQIVIKDITVFPIEVIYHPEDEHLGRQPIHTTLFNEFGSIGTRKIMTFKRQSDFEFDVKYGKPVDEQDVETDLDQIAKVRITGLTEAMEKYKEDIQSAEQPPKVRVSIELSNSGLLSVPEASLSFQAKDSGSSFSDKVKSFFGSKEEETQSEEETAKETVQADQNQTESEKGEKKTEEEEKPKPKEPTLKKIPLNVEFIGAGPVAMSNEEKLIARQRIQALDTLDEKRRLREESRNNLESFVYRIQDFLYDDTVGIVSTEEQQEHLREQLSETSDWLYDDGETADTKEYIDRLRKLQSLERPITFRRQEYLQRGDNIKRVDSSVQLARVFVENILTNTPEEERYHTKEELETVLNHANKVDAWKVEKVSAQEKRDHHLDPIFTTVDVNKQCRELDEALMKLMKKKKPKVTKKQAPKNETTEEQEEVVVDNGKKEGEDEPVKSDQGQQQESSEEEHRKHDEL
ncbi:Hsp70 protein-domain-containing protein [Phascolomyces articulosus]|uniref:Hsp70 protein-domain-containing protein n=1 Tax=Phascolomyces articulosus TaxID=60185 RepID=A0AAD5JWX1_9FUNG|nr:Hsp70 protein-domain-containing protein [Phascolomyces articulosus]